MDAKSPQVQARFYERAIKRDNDPQAMVNLAELLFSEKHNLLDTARAVQLLQRAIKQYSDPTAMNNLALHYLHNGNASQRRQVIPLLERSLRMEEDSIVLRNLSDAVKDVRCGAPDPQIAVQLCERALRFGEDPKCIEALAYNLLTVPGIKTDSRRAVRLYKKAIRVSDDAEAMNRLGVCYVDGTEHLKPCSNRAAKWFERAIKVGDLPEAKCNLAYLLAGDDLPESRRDPVRAVSLLEEACKQVRSDVCMRTLAKIYRDVEEVYNLSRSIELLEASLVEFKSASARVSLLDIFLGFKRPPPDHAKALQLCQDDYARTRDVASLRVMSCILWSGASNVEANPQRALELMRQHKKERLPEEVSALRYQSETPEDHQKLIDPLPKIGFYSTKLIHAILLSETDIDSNLAEAGSLFREILEEPDAKVMFAWLPLSLRVCGVELPFHGNRSRMTHAMKRATHCYEAGLLNLASFLLEEGGKDAGKAEAVQLLEDAMETGLRLIAVLNLGFVLWTGAGGVPKERQRAMDLFEASVEESNDACSRVLLANALVDREECDEEAIQRSVRLWKSVQEEYKEDEEEVSKLTWMISERTSRTWASRGV